MGLVFNKGSLLFGVGGGLVMTPAICCGTTVTVVLSGIGAVPGGCTSCAAYNDTFVLDIDCALSPLGPTGAAGANNNCAWEYNSYPDECEDCPCAQDGCTNALQVFLSTNYNSATDQTTLNVGLANSSTCSGVTTSLAIPDYFLLTVDGVVSCTTSATYTLDFTAAPYNPLINAICDLSSATCTVTFG